MEITPLSIAGAFVITPRQFRDDRGVFLEAFRGDLLERHLGRRPDIIQTNVSVSRRGTVRGIHLSDVPPGQAKYVMALSGSLVDYVIDLRIGSPTFGAWDSVLLDTSSRQAVYIGEGLGHAFCALDEPSAAFIRSTPRSPSNFPKVSTRCFHPRMLPHRCSPRPWIRASCPATTSAATRPGRTLPRPR